MPETPETLESIDAEIAQLQGQIATAQEGGAAAGPDYSAFFKSPGYDFRFDEGVRAMDRSASARGQLMSGGQMRELQRYGQGLASSEFNNYANRLATIAGIGQSANFTGGQLGGQIAGQVGTSAANIGQSIMAGGSALASGQIGSANAVSQGIGNIASNPWLQQWGSGLFSSGAASTGATGMGVNSSGLIANAGSGSFF